MDLAKLKTTGSACACWVAVKKKLILSTEGLPSNGYSPLDALNETRIDHGSGNDAAMPSSAIGTPAKPKATTRKRVPNKPKAKAGAEVEAEAEAEGENGVAADDEQTPTTTPKKSGGAKRKAPEPSSPIKAETSDDAVDHGEEAATDENPAKKKRVYNRKPKDPNTPTAKPRAKKGAIAVATTNVVNAPLLDQAEGEVEVGGEHSSMFGDGNINVEGPDELTEEERYLAQEAMDEQTFGLTNGKANGDEVTF